MSIPISIANARSIPPSILSGTQDICLPSSTIPPRNWYESDVRTPTTSTQPEHRCPCICRILPLASTMSQFVVCWYLLQWSFHLLDLEPFECVDDSASSSALVDQYPYGRLNCRRVLDPTSKDLDHIPPLAVYELALHHFLWLQPLATPYLRAKASCFSLAGRSRRRIA
jgi:hypothetical protein